VEGSDDIALGALGASAVAVWYARRADQRAAEAERRDVERLDAERRDRDEGRRARLVVVSTGGSGGPTAAPVSHDFEISNVGRAPATAFYVWIVDEASGVVVSSTVGGRGILAPGDSAKPGAVEVYTALLSTSPRLTVWVRWEDEAGRDEQPTDVHPPLHHGPGGDPRIHYDAGRGT
jgi:hypothetical protein